MRRAALSLLAFPLAVLALVAASAFSAPRPFERARVEIRTGERVVRLDVELARTERQRALGLMHRTSLRARAGMLFLFARDSRVGFWMKNTRIPLSIAFIDRRGVILRILDMAPCRRDSCPLYDPGVTYRSALEVNRGSFVRWRVRPGDVVRVRR